MDNADRRQQEKPLSKTASVVLGFLRSLPVLS
jgi:hypothetical protein